MKVILLEDIKGVGEKLDVKEVKDGYARNFLLPKKMAEAATPQALKRLIEEKSKIEEESEKLAAILEERAGKIKDLTLSFKRKNLPAGRQTREKKEVFGSVNAKDIERALEKHGIPDVRVDLEKPIKTLGETSVPVDLGEGIKTKVSVLVEKEDR
ncbi:MAG: 50S ribosomal protein L9 [Patescibacteria group bacterium]|nr:50S ribosomal protein L9 [Patescibacteria group bacterium]